MPTQYFDPNPQKQVATQQMKYMAKELRTQHSKEKDMISMIDEIDLLLGSGNTEKAGALITVYNGLL
jgi:hypothetical protein